MSVSALLALVACVLFVLAALSIAVGGVLLVPLGLAFLAAAHVV